jgi:peroxiredoxin Q/BCP
MLADGDSAPDFDLPTDASGRIRLRDLKGRRVVLYFYPKDDTPGCTLEAKRFSALRAEFEAAGAVLVGLSPDSPASHDKFKAKHGLAISLASDEDAATARAYGVWVEKSMYGRTFMGVERSTFLIGPSGRIERSWRKVKPEDHAEEVLAALRAKAR